MNDDATDEVPAGPRLSRVLLSILAWTLVALAAFFLWPTNLGGCTTFTIVSGESMEPTYHTGDIVLSRCGTPEIGDVVVYQPERLDGARIIHRVVGGESKTGWQLQGDNNDFVDDFDPTDAEVLGVARLHLPRLGLWVEALANPWVWASMITLALALFVWPNRNADADADDREDDDDDLLGDDASDDLLDERDRRAANHAEPNEIEPYEHDHGGVPDVTPAGATR